MLLAFGFLSFVVKDANAQGSRRAEPNVLSTGYYAVDSDDNAPTPWRPNYFFVDTTFQPFTWTRIGSGPQQFYTFPNYFYRPSQLGGAPENMDTTDNCMAGPVNIGFKFNFYGIDYDSLIISSNGFVGFRPRAETWANSGTYGNLPMYCSPLAVDLRSNPGSAPRAIIAAMHADLDFRRGNDSSRVYVRMSPSQDSFFVNYYNLRIRPSTNNPFFPNGSGRDRLFITKMQVVITRNDSSIQVNYGAFAGTILSFPPVQAWRVFQNNSSLGVVDHNGSASTSVLYRNSWHAVNIYCRGCNRNFRQQGQWAIKYKRWKNVVRAVKVDFPTRNYEICLGATIQPRATYQNVDLVTRTFKAKFQIRNVVTGVAVYGRVITLNGVAAGAQRTDSSFPPYITSPNILTQLGTFTACAVATPYDAADNFLGDQWPFDDTICLRIYGIRTNQLPFNEPSNDYSVTPNSDIPDQRRWVSIGATVHDGDGLTFDPPPPRDLDGVGFGSNGYKSPVIKIDRTDFDGNYYPGQNVGDTLLSFPFNVANQTKASIAFSYMRTGNVQFPMYWDRQILVGPEHTVLTSAGASWRPGDSLVLEFKRPDQPACNPSLSAWTRILAVDGGNDFEFQKVSAKLDRYLPATNYMTKDFRFRLRLKAKDDGPSPPDDDADEWFVDNISLQVPRKPEIEVMWVRVVHPYTKVPASQAVSMPIMVHVANNSSDVAVAFPIRTQIISPTGETVYWAIQTVTSLRGGTDTTIQMPNWNAQLAGSAGEFIVHSWVAQNGYDSYTDDNGTFTRFFLDINPPGSTDPQEFAYDDNTNDWPALTNIQGTGIGFNNNSGSFAMKFRLMAKDTIYGARVFMANANQSPDAVRLTLLKGSPACAPVGDTVGGGYLEDVRRGQLFNQFWPYYFPQPIVVAGGKNSPTQGYYWLSFSQLSLDNYILGADISRGGGRIVISDPISPSIPPVYRSPYGTLLSQYNSTGDISCAFALELTSGSGTWGLMAPNIGYWPHDANAAGGWRLAWSKGLCNPCAIFINQPPWQLYYWMGGGGPFPMIRAMVSKSEILPVELLYLTGTENNGKAVLTWGTAQETNNQGFYIERRDARYQSDFFQKIGFVQGKGTTTTATGYSYIDRNVTPGQYQYRLIQTDIDGQEKVSNIVEVGISLPNSYELEQNFPNPFDLSNGTDISFKLPVGAETKLVIYNSVGQVVRTLINGYKDAGTHKVMFNGKDEAGVELASGNYFYKLTSGSFTETRKLTISK
jgi:hypothetical protein